MTNDHGNLGRRAVLSGALGTAGALALAAPADASPRFRRRPRVLIATNEPWGTYHVRPLLDEAARCGVRLTQLVPDMSGIDPDETVPVATPRDAPDADLLVVTGADDWPLECARRFGRLPRAAGSLAYLGPEEAPGADRIRHRLRLITASSPAEARSFGGYLGTRRRIHVVGSPQTDGLPERAPEPGLVLVITSVTRSDETGGAAPGTELLLAAAERLRAAGKRILVGLHPREDRSLWERYEISDVPTLRASARAEAAIGIPGTIFPLVAAVGTPVVGCTDPALSVPDYLLSVCSGTIGAAGEAVPAVAGARPPDAAVLADAVGPIGGSAARLLNAWTWAARPRRH
ncbi:hypothetical protein [Actinomadura sp. WMMB 499]|uniref:hypothetical protein n=1 Tax=Actinomadura sp. WMMB 499 TaxID=1219491 RepID=UPI001243B1A3|nr:hypothetical protein [Actinomadura sp. WMMB 499]QFG23979.1 hypothetical protein F7P10_25490 [Actinomadura sp. WMMB 499]